MRIGTDESFLSLDLVPIEGGYTVLRAASAGTSLDSRFTAFHDRLMLDASDEAIEQFADFELLKSKGIEIPLTEGGWLRFERDSRGYIMVHYRIGGLMASAAMEGRILVEGEFARAFCCEIGQILRGQRSNNS